MPFSEVAMGATISAPAGFSTAAPGSNSTPSLLMRTARPRSLTEVETVPERPFLARLASIDFSAASSCLVSMICPGEASERLMPPTDGTSGAIWLVGVSTTGAGVPSTELRTLGPPAVRPLLKASVRLCLRSSNRLVFTELMANSTMKRTYMRVSTSA